MANIIYHKIYNISSKMILKFTKNFTSFYNKKHD